MSDRCREGTACRVLAWPDYRSARELRSLVGSYARLLLGQDDVVLGLWWDPAHDPDFEDSVGAFQRAWITALGDDCPGPVEFHDADTDPSPRFDAVIALPSKKRELLASPALTQPVRVVGSPLDLKLLITRAALATRERAWRWGPGMPRTASDPVWDGLGLDANAFAGALVVELYPGGRLRTLHFGGALIHAVEPRAEDLREHLWWCDLDRAHRLYARDPADRIEELRSLARLVVIGEAADDHPRRNAMLDVALTYLADDGVIVLRSDHFPHASLIARELEVHRCWAPPGGDRSFAAVRRGAVAAHA
ncbi:MAG: hypothetical protein CMJ83_08370 [Planctomycetes bacterium]|nr:hypothetical protein [Planctomycetota bacterium]